MGERVRLRGILTVFQTCQSSARSSGGGGVRGQLWPEVLGKSSTSGRQPTCMYVCGSVLAYSRGTTSGTSEQSGCCCKGHHGGRSTPPTFLAAAYPQPFFSLLSTVHLIAPPVSVLLTVIWHHDRVLLAADRWAFTWNHSLRQERPCERLCCVEEVQGRGTACREGKRAGRRTTRSACLLLTSLYTHLSY